MRVILMIVMMTENRNVNYKGSAFRKLSWEKKSLEKKIRKYKLNELFV